MKCLWLIFGCPAKKQNVKITEKILKIVKIDLYNYEMPRDIIFRLE